jgi:hypothetical protein
VVWVSRIASLGEPRVASQECPVSYVTGMSWVWLEDYLTFRELGGTADLKRWPARRVDAFVTLQAEVRKAQGGRDGE